MKPTLLAAFAFALLLNGVPSRAVETFSPSRAPYDAPVEDERGIVALDQALREISNPFTVVSIAARPGDEDDGALAYVRKKLGARTVMLFATRGEGEDSPTVPALDLELAAIHTREALEAARTAGTDVFFLNLRDIGYSKSAEEALSAWGHDEALGRMVRAIRSLRADVILTNHDPKTGEGVAQAVARLALEAFNAAADTKQAPEAGSDPWQPRRFFQRAEQAAADVSINLNEYDRLRGVSYAQIGLSAHQRFRSRGAALDRMTFEREASYYRLIAPASDEKMPADGGFFHGLTLPENVTRSIAQPRVGDLAPADAITAGDRLIESLQEKLTEKRLEGTADEMRARYGVEFARVVRFTAAIERSLTLALGLSLEVTLSDRVVVPGQKVTARLVLRNGGARAFPVVFSAPDRIPTAETNPIYKDSEVMGIGTGGALVREIDYEIAKETPLTLPRSAHLYDEEYYALGAGLPGAQPAEPFGNRVIASAYVGLGQVNVRLAAVARFDVAPPVEIETIPFVLLKDWTKPRDIEFTARVRNRTPRALAGALWVVPIALTQDEYEPVHIAFSREDQEVTIELKLRLPILKPPLAPDVLIEFRPEKPAPPDPLGSAKIAVKAIDFDVAEGLKVGYIRGLSDWLARALTQLGVQHTELKIDDLSAIEHGNTVNASAHTRPGCSDLARFDTIIVDTNAYFTHRELMPDNRCLLRYVRQGGNLIVLGQRADDLNLVLSNAQLAPFPIKLSLDRLATETARVKLLDAAHPLLSLPNKIGPADFDDWAVERAANIPREWSSEYAALLESGDAGEEPSRGAMLAARSGEGTYAYTSLSWRRQLQAGNAGAYRLFANLVSLPKTGKSVSK